MQTLKKYIYGTNLNFSDLQNLGPRKKGGEGKPDPVFLKEAPY